MKVSNDILVYDLGDMVKLHNLNMESVRRHILAVDRKHAFLGMATAFVVLSMAKKIAKLEQKVDKLDQKIEEVAERTIKND